MDSHTSKGYTSALILTYAASTCHMRCSLLHAGSLSVPNVRCRLHKSILKDYSMDGPCTKQAAFTRYMDAAQQLRTMQVWEAKHRHRTDLSSMVSCSAENTENVGVLGAGWLLLSKVALECLASLENLGPLPWLVGTCRSTKRLTPTGCCVTGTCAPCARQVSAERCPIVRDAAEVAAACLVLAMR